MHDFSDDTGYEVAFEATTDGMAIADATDGEWRVRDVNGTFEGAFDRETESIRGERLRAVLDVRDVGLPDPDRAGDAGTETVADVDPVGGECLVRARPFETADGGERLLVVLSDSPDLDPAATGTGGGRAVDPIHGVEQMARADDAAAACEGAATLLLEYFGFDAFVADVDGTERRPDGVDAPIPVDHPDDGARPSAHHDVRDDENDEEWAVVVTQSVGTDGVIQVGARDDAPDDRRASQSVELVGRYLDTVLDDPDRERRLREERDEAALYNRILRHSVLNGLNLIRARLDLLATDVSEDTREHFDTAYARVGDMIDRVEAIREMQSDDASASETEPRALAPLVEDRLERAREKHPEASFTLDGTVPDVDVVANPLLEFCLRNLLRNSVQHADVETPEVGVAAAVSDDVARVRITDNGPGLPDGLEESVFGDGVSSLDGAGHGAGLFLTRRIVEEVYGGTVRAGNSDRGGAAFVVELPVADDRARESDVPSAD